MYIDIDTKVNIKSILVFRCVYERIIFYHYYRRYLPSRTTLSTGYHHFTLMLSASSLCPGRMGTSRAVMDNERFGQLALSRTFLSRDYLTLKVD